MNYLIVFVQLGILVHINADYDLKCPTAGQWRLRAQSYCPHEEMYTCLYYIDPDEQKYIETCKGPRKESPGEKPVINSGNFDNVDCSEDRYQPILFSTTEGSNCLYLKSNCNEEGQFIYSNGSTKQDRTCGCNYVEQYVFLSQNISHPCYCRPSVEDCTCHKKACDSGFRLSPDYKCVPENETSGRYNCKEIVTLEKDKVVNLTKSGFEEEKLEGRQRDLAFIYTVPLLVLVLFGVLWMVLFLKRIQIYDHCILCTTKDDKIKRAAYLDDIKKKTEKRFYIRVMIVGKHGVGKSCLLRRLLGEGIEGVESTDGINIVVRRCKIRLSDGKWIVDADPDPKRLYAARIKRAMQQENVEYEVKTMDTTTISMQTFPVPFEHSTHAVETNKQEEFQISETAEDRPSGQHPGTFASEQKTHITREQKQTRQPTGSLTSTRNLTKVLTHEVEKELEHFLSRIETYENENEEYVEIGFWDFAGEKDYYGTHYLFLDSHALYLLVTDCSDELKQTETCVTYDSIGEYVDFWFDTIHNCTDVEEDNTNEHLDPPIIAVCTGLDKLTEPVNKKKEQYCQRYRDAIQDEQKRKHFRNICFVSNSEPSDADFNHVRDLIFEYGKRLKSFGETLPLKWIRLEQSLDVLRKSGFNIVSRYDVIDLSAKCDFNEQEREIQVEKFLKHQHKNGSIIYSSDINNFVILSQQWLANAFKCLVSDKIDRNIQLSEEWEKLEKTGILEMSLITKLFKKKPKLKFDKYQKHIIDVLNKFDVVGINYEEGRPLYYMPYMITSSYSPSLSVIFKTFGASNEECKQTPWLCLEFAFFPLAFFTHVILYYVKNYTMCFDSKLNKPSIYHGVGVFFLDDAQVNKLIVVFCKNTIAIQVWYWDPVAEDRYIEILSEIRKVIDSLKMRYEGHKLRYTVKVKCSDGDVISQMGRVSNTDLLDKSRGGKYFCTDHDRYHDSSQLFNTWFHKYSDDFSRAEENKDTESVDSVRCQLCVSDPRPAVSWCTECVQAMCRECTTVHLTQPTSSTHTTVLLTLNFRIKGIGISDIASLFEGVLIISDRIGKQLITCNIRGHDKQFIPLPYEPFRLSVIDQNNVAVTAYHDKKVLIVDVRQKNITKEFDIKECWGIMYIDNHLYVSCSDKTLVKVDLSGEIIRTVPLSFRPYCICSGTEGRIYCTGSFSNTVYCIDTEGNTEFTVTNPDMYIPYSITTDNEGHVLVVCRTSKNVHRISPDGIQCDVIIKDIPLRIRRYPRICYDSISKSIVIGIKDTFYVYKI